VTKKQRHKSVRGGRNNRFAPLRIWSPHPSFENASRRDDVCGRKLQFDCYRIHHPAR